MTFPRWLDSESRSVVQKLINLGHILEVDEEGEINMFALEYDHHNGPRCTRCGLGWCHHCPIGDDDYCDGEGEGE